jgi:hypothetical protein
LAARQPEIIVTLFQTEPFVGDVEKTGCASSKPNPHDFIGGFERLR